MKAKKLLIITSSGGGGLIQTANAKEQEAKDLDPNVIIVKKDLLKNWVARPLGLFFITFWNTAQKKGSVTAQRLCVWGQFIIDFVIYPSIFFHALYTFFKEDIDEIIDTQPLGTSAIIKALKIYNKKRKKNVLLEKVMVDLPTKKATHFCSAIKKLSNEDRKLIKLTSIAPLLDRGESAEEFWQKMCNLSEKEVNLVDVYVRKAFQKYKSLERCNKKVTILIKIKNEEERALSHKSFEMGSIVAKDLPDAIEFEIEPEVVMVTVLLGSQPSGNSTLNYVKSWIELCRKNQNKKTALFVYCQDHIVGESSLFKKVSNLVSQSPNFPKNLSVIPFSFQSEEIIAPLFYRSNATCTRSGGQTAMELMCVSHGEIWIHSEAKSGQPILKGMPGWESESAVYLETLHGAKIVTTETFLPLVSVLY